MCQEEIPKQHTNVQRRSVYMLRFLNTCSLVKSMRLHYIVDISQLPQFSRYTYHFLQIYFLTTISVDVQTLYPHFLNEIYGHFFNIVGFFFQYLWINVYNIFTICKYVPCQTHCTSLSIIYTHQNTDKTIFSLRLFHTV